MSRHRDDSGGVRVRYGRLAALGASLVTTVVALLGGVGVLPSGASPSADAPPRAELSSADVARSAESSAAPTVTTAPADTSADGPAAVAVEEPALPADSGRGRRVVFDQSDQRVWIVAANGDVLRTYLVSGSTRKNLRPGTFEVFSRSKDALGVDGSEMRLFVRFTIGFQNAIGFHTIPTDPDNGDRPVQTKEQLGTPLSHGCIRQKTRDAQAMWRFAQLGTKVVVVA